MFMLAQPWQMRHREDVERGDGSMEITPDASSDRTIDLARHRCSCSLGPWQLRHRKDDEQGPTSAPTLLMT
jgi:hypothetical protein